MLALLCWLRGGVDAQIHSWVFGAILTLTGWFLARPGTYGANTAVPWPVAGIAILPLLQLVPLGSAQAWLWPVWRQDLTQVFAELGVAAPSSVSLYPYATLQRATVLAGCCAVFVLACAAAQRSRDNVIALAAAVLTLAAVEAALGLLQAIGDVPDLVAAAGSGSAARGTFTNRNHFSVLLEAGLCIALGLGAVAASTGRSTVGAMSRLLAWSGIAAWSCKLAAVLCVAGIAASGSRMGILIAFAVALASPFLIVQRGKRRVPYLSLSLAVVVLVATLSLPGSSRGFEQLFEYGGDPERIAIWSDTVPAATRHLAAGSGLGTFAFAFQRSRVYFPRNTVDHAHSDWLEFLVEMGLPAALFAAIAIAGAFAFCLRRGRQGPLGLLRTALLMGAAVILVHSTVDFPLQIPALAALFSVLLGSAVGLADPAKRRVPAGPATRAIAALGCLSFGALAAAAAAGLPPSWNAESLFAAGHREFLAGRGAEAERRLRKALEANPYSALAWQKRAEIARMNGQPERAHQLVALAARLEPFTFRTEWPLAESLLQDRRWEPAAARLGNLAESIPDVRPAILRAALEAGMPMALIDEAVVPGGAGGIWLRALADREAWDQFERSLASRTAAGVTAAGVTVAGVAATGVTASPGELRYLFDRLFQFQQQRLMQHLWRAVRPKEFSESPSWRLAALTHHQTQGSGPSGNSANIPATRTTTLHRANNDFSDLPGPLDSGFGFQWVAHLVQNVQIRIPAARQPAARFELDFRAPTAAESVHLSHYFAVAPAASYVLQADAKAKNLGGGEVTLEVWSARRLLASSTLARGSASRRIEVPFRAGASEEVLQLRVVSRRGGPLKAMHGTLFVGPFQLRSVHPASLVTEDR